MADVTLKAILMGEDRTLSKTMNRAGSSVEGVGKKAKITGGVIKGFLAAGFIEDAARAIVDFGEKSVDSYADLEDSTAAASVIFGKNMTMITKQAETANRTLGMSKQQVINAANAFGTYGKAAGKTGKDLASFSTQMTSLAGDMASFKGTSPEEAIQAIGAALRGEMEPIRKYGVMLDDASLRQEAMRMGLIKTTKQGLTPQQKSLAAHRLILKQTKDMQGDFARTADSTANVMKSQKAKVEDLSASFGEKLAPAMTRVNKRANDMLDWMNDNPEALDAFGAGLDNLGAGFDVVGDTFAAVGVLLNNVIATVSDKMADMLAVMGMIPGFDWAKKASTDLRLVASDARLTAANLGMIGKQKVIVNTLQGETNVKKLKANIQSIRGKIVEAKARGDAKEVIRLRGEIAKIRGKVVTITANVRLVANSIRIGAIAGGLIGVKHALGGPEYAGMPRWVGEHGPELFIPSQNGLLKNQFQLKSQAPAAAAVRAAGNTYKVYISVAPGADLKEFGRTAEKALRQVQDSRGGRPLNFKSARA